MVYNCDICGCVGFKSPGALASHKATSRACKLARVRKEVDAPRARLEVQKEPTILESQTARDYIRMTDPGSSSLGISMIKNVEDVLSTPFSDFFKESQAKDRFDSTLHLVAFIRQCRNTMGLSIKDIRKLLGLLYHPEFSLLDVEVRNIDDLHRYEKKIASTETVGWKQVIVRRKDECVPQLLLHYQDPIEALSTLFSNAKNSTDFKLYPTKSVHRNCYSSLDTGEWWRQMQDEIEKKCPGGVIAAIILYSDQTSLSNNQRVTGYPLMMSLANIECVGRREEAGHVLLAILPTYGASDPDITKSRNPTRLKLSLLHTCLTIILAPFKALSYTGFPLEDPWGSQQWVFPLLFADVGDHPETCKLTCTFDTNCCNFPCSVCFCPKHQLHAITVKHEYRKEAQMKAICNELLIAPTNAVDDLSKSHSVHPVECALWGFNGGDTTLGNPYRSLHPDKMHQFELGLFKTFIGILKEIATQSPRVTFKRRPLQILDERLAWVGEHHRYPEFRIPARTGRTGYFTSTATFQAFEHRFVFQVIIPLLLGVYQTPVIQVVIGMWEWYSIAFRVREHTDESLDEMDKMMEKMVTKMRVVLGQYQKSDFDIIKVHSMSHLSDSIRRSGIPSEYSTDMYEHLHILLMKVPYRASNKKDFAKQMARHHERLLALGRKISMTERIEISIESDTALDKAVKTGTNVLMGSRIQLHMDWLIVPLEDVPRSGQDLFSAQPEIQTELLRAIDSFVREKNLKDIETLKVKNGVAITAGVGERFGDWPMIARSKASFHGGPYFSDVAIQMEAEGEDPLTSYAQLRLVFSCRVTSQSGAQGVRDLAFVRWFDCKKRRERTTGCLILQPRVSAYDVVEVANILRVVQLVPHYGIDEDEPHQFLLNRFKF